jgi:hypothetical protein
MNRTARRFVFAAALAALPAFCFAADFDDPEKAKDDAAYQAQGEYLGTATTDTGETAKYGAQVIALGGGKFHMVGYKAGLPGDGWKRGDETHEADGVIKDGVVTFDEQSVTVTLKEGVISLTSKDGKPAGSMKKVERTSPTMGKKPPEGAVVLFDGTKETYAKHWKETDKLAADGLLKQGSNTKDTFKDQTLHVEFRLSFMPDARGQGRSNSGVYVQGRYETQVLDSFGLAGEDNECGGIYHVGKPTVNMCLPPLLWQTYDIEFTAPKFENGKKTSDAVITVTHNGVVVQDHVKVPGPTAGAPAQENDEPSFLHLQDHGNQVRYRNIWVVEKK